MMTDKLLQVLDMTEEEQHTEIVRLAWHLRKTSPALANYHREAMGGYMEISLADLAFRQRDKVVANQGDIAWHKAVVKVCEYMGKGTAWFKNYGQPIHWIVASLIAKGLAKEKRRPL